MNLSWSGLGGKVGLVLAMIFAPPFAFVGGIIGAVLLWIALGGTDLPGWARLGLSVMAVTAVPGVWFVVLPILFARSRVHGVPFPSGVLAWQEAQMRAWERHSESFRRLGRQRINRVIASGHNLSADGMSVTLVALALGNEGGDFTIAHHPLDPPDDDEPDTAEVIAAVADDYGTEYAVVTTTAEMAGFGGRASIAFIPAPPAAATELRLTINGIFRLAHADARTGTWEFVVPLGGGAS